METLRNRASAMVNTRVRVSGTFTTKGHMIDFPSEQALNDWIDAATTYFGGTDSSGGESIYQVGDGPELMVPVDPWADS